MISGAYPPSGGGIATHVDYLSEALSTLTRSKYSNTKICRVEVITATGTSDRVESEAKHPAGAAGKRPFLITHRLPGQNSHFLPHGDVPFAQPIKYILDNWSKMERPDIVHAHDYEAFQIGLMVKTAFQVPLVFTVHRTPKETDHSLRQRDPKNTFLQLIRQRDLADAVVAPSKAYLAHLLGEQFPEHRLKQIYHGVPVAALEAIQNRGGVCDRLDLAPDAQLVFCPMRLDPHKGPETFVDAAAIVNKRLNGCNIVFAIAGSGSNSYRATLERRAKDQGVDQVVRLGAVDRRDFLPQEMPTLYRRASVCVLPSRREGFGQVILAAFVFGCPVIGANTGGIPEVIKPNDTGLLFNRDEPEDLAEQMLRMLGDETLRSHVAMSAKREVLQRFDANTMARQYMQLYQELTSIALSK